MRFTEGDIVVVLGLAYFPDEYVIKRGRDDNYMIGNAETGHDVALACQSALWFARKRAVLTEITR